MKQNWQFSVSCRVWLEFIDMFCTFFVVSPFLLSPALWFGGIHQLLFRTLFDTTLTLIGNLLLFLAITETAFSHSGILWSFGSVGDPCATKCQKEETKDREISLPNAWRDAAFESAALCFRLFASALCPRRPVCRSLCRCRSFGRPPTTESSVRGLTASASPSLHKILCLFGKSYRDNFGCSPYGYFQVWKKTGRQSECIALSTLRSTFFYNVFLLLHIL